MTEMEQDSYEDRGAGQDSGSLLSFGCYNDLMLKSSFSFAFDVESSSHVTAISPQIC